MNRPLRALPSWTVMFSNAALIVAGICTQTAFAQSEKSWGFDVLLDGKKVGYHSYTVADDGAEKTTTSEASFEVKLLFITAFRYRHVGVETWNDNCLTSIEAVTNSNGKVLGVTGESSNGVLAVTSSGGETGFTQCVKSFAYWNPSILEADALLNAQTGEYVQIDVTPLGRDSVMFDTREIEARKYALRSRNDAAGKPVDLVLWYSADTMQWLGLESTVNGNRVLRYAPARLPSLEAQRSASLYTPADTTKEAW